MGSPDSRIGVFFTICSKLAKKLQSRVAVVARREEVGESQAVGGDWTSRSVPIVINMASGRGGGLDRCKQRRQAEGALVPDGVDEEGRRRRDSAAHGTFPNVPDALGVDMGAHLAPEPKEVQAGLGRVLVKMHVRRRHFAFEHGIVHFPELALRGRALGGLGRFLGLPELLGLREAPVDVAQIRAHLLLRIVLTVR